ncbi:AAA family ATPase [Rhodococcus triatomae]|uniref:MinD-like ATPase involved in chromosome partitioning or flagellar assembly n=1 Tax=Rhodococcus triatomae TaxID=300028 RepID=A0A1G8J731_9NOCA|nr:MinD/ParA family protein [Rhodococcus triatomae]QNG19795.1 AAA family ATPase [Rhodococcus triatomae]QNG24289.1 AAA family ATPase [Rhodococcus triatomae]SDI27054.1 MinD-like ATPase involved in chromosome partitioning or flagellar assembly [Rhodococcus triatomae]
MADDNVGGWEPARPAGEADRARRTRQPYVQPQGPNPFAPPPQHAPGQSAPAGRPPQAPAPDRSPGPAQRPADPFSPPGPAPGQARPQAPTQHAPAPERNPGPPQQPPRPPAPQPERQQASAPAPSGPADFGPDPESAADSQYSVSSRDLSTSLLLKKAKPIPTTGWRKALYRMSGRRVNVGPNAKERHRLELTRQINQPLQGCYKIALLSLKGGVGKTTTTATLGSTFASLRGDRVVAVDANPDRGTLSQKIPLETPATVRNLLRDTNSIERYSDVRAYTSQSRHRLEVLASDSDPAVSEAFSGEDYSRTVALLEKYYSIVLTDCGTGLMHSAMRSTLEEADAIIVVSSGSVDGARSASATLDWLDAHGYRDLVARSVAVVNAVRPRSAKVDLMKVVEHFEQRCRAVRTIPFDPHLEEGAEIDLDRLRPKTRKALLELAAAVAADFPSTSTAVQEWN